VSKFYLLAGILSLGIIVLIGCGNSKHGRVRGKVTLDGAVLSDGIVTFHPVQGKGSIASGTLNPNGQFELLVGEENQIPIGVYAITVIATEPLPESATGEEPGQRDITPTKYASVDTSELKFTVTPGAHHVSLELKSN
jgi:hypothetical protein